MMRYKRPESVLVLVHTADKQVLVLRRIDPPHFWQSVAGSLEWGESAESAARRELFEETGLAADGLTDCRLANRYLLYPLWRARYAPAVIENKEHVFRLELETACPVVLDPREHGEFVWLPAAEAALLVSSHTNRAAIERWAK